MLMLLMLIVNIADEQMSRWTDEQMSMWENTDANTDAADADEAADADAVDTANEQMSRWADEQMRRNLCW